MKPKIVATSVLFFLFTQATAVANSGNCKKSEVLELAKSGFSKEEIIEVCNEATEHQNCCCIQVFGKYGETVRKDLLSYYLTGERTYFNWESADLCGVRSNSMCVNASYCGRD